MDRQKGIAFCGLVCALCSENTNCAGCRNGGCPGKEQCPHLLCCGEKGLNGCWECDQFPCKAPLFQKTRIRAFVRFIRQYGSEFLLDCLERNERNGLVYHYPGGLVGDYDIPETEEEIIKMILYGRIDRNTQLITRD